MALPSRKEKSAVGATVALATLLHTAVASAHAPRLSVAEGSDIEGCPPPADFRRALTEQLGRDLADDPSTAVVLDVQRSETGNLVARLVVTTRDGESVRSLGGSGDTCPDLVRAAVLALGLALQKEPAPPPKAPPPIPPPDHDAGSRDRSLRADRVVATASAITSIGLLPRPGAGVGGSARVRLSEAIWLSGRGFYLPETTMPNDTFAAGLAGGGLGVCAEPFGSAQVVAVGCVHAIAGGYGTSRGTVTAAEGDRVYGGGSLSAGVRARAFGPIHVEALADAHFPVVRPTILAAQCPPSGFEAPFAALALLAGAGVSIP